MALELDDFQIITGVLELRYPDHFLIWDNSGAFWQELANELAPLKVKQAEPNGVSVRIDKHAQAALGIDRASITVTKPGAHCERLKELAIKIVPALITKVKIDQFSRIGMRVVFEKAFSSREEAAKYVFENTSFPERKDNLMNVSGQGLDPELGFRSESESKGYSVKILARQGRIVDFNLPAGFEQLQPTQEELVKNQVLIDVDYYVHSVTLADQVSAEQIVDGWIKVIRRDLTKVING